MDIFYGQFKSVVDCPTCQYESIQFDPFSVCSLPLINNNKKKIEVIFIKNHVHESKIIIAYDAAEKKKLPFLETEVRNRVEITQGVKIIFYVATYQTCDILQED